MTFAVVVFFLFMFASVFVRWDLVEPLLLVMAYPDLASGQSRSISSVDAS